MSDDDRTSIGGAELNTAITVTALGGESTWLSVLPTNDGGISEHAHHHGVESIIFREEGRFGEYSVHEDEKRVGYDRSNSVFAGLDADSIPIRNIMQGHEWVHLTGITPMLGDGPRALWNRVMIFSELDDIKLSLDINHRPALSSREELWEIIEPHLRKVHLLTLSSTDLQWIAEQNGWQGNDENLVQRVASKWLINAVGCTFKEDLEGRRSGWQKRWSILASPSEVVSTRDSPIIHRPVEHLGSGDAWVGALLNLQRIRISKQEIIKADRVATLQQSTFGDALDVEFDYLSRAYNSYSITSRMMQNGIIPIIREKDHDLAVEVARRMIESGSKVVEVSLDTPGAERILPGFKSADHILGIGTITKSIPQVFNAYRSGARFLLSKVNPEGFIEECKNFDMLAIPGVSSIAEARSAISEGAIALKLFHWKNDWTIEEALKLREEMPRIILIPVGGIHPQEVQELFEIGMDIIGLGASLRELKGKELQRLFSQSSIG